MGSRLAIIHVSHEFLTTFWGKYCCNYYFLKRRTPDLESINLASHITNKWQKGKLSPEPSQSSACVLKYLTASHRLKTTSADFERDNVCNMLPPTPHGLSRARLCHPTDSSPRGSSVHGILQARILGWVTISYSRGSFQPRNQTHVSVNSCMVRQILYQ